MASDSEPENQTAPDDTNNIEEKTDKGNPNVAVAAGGSATPPSKTHCQITLKTEKTFWDKVKTGAEIFGIFCLLVYTIYTIKMYSVNKTAAEAATSAANTAYESLVSIQRAFVWYKGHQESTLLDAKGKRLVMFQILWENSGNTGAENVTHFVAVDNEFVGEPTEDQFQRGFGHKAPTYREHIPPKAPMTITVGTVEESSILIPDHPPVFWGWVSYNDIFPKTPLHISEFCEIGKSVLRSSTDNTFVTSEVCHRHNCSDHHCEDYDEMVKYISGLNLH